MVARLLLIVLGVLSWTDKEGVVFHPGIKDGKARGVHNLSSAVFTYKTDSWLRAAASNSPPPPSRRRESSRPSTSHVPALL